MDAISLLSLLLVSVALLALFYDGSREWSLCAIGLAFGLSVALLVILLS